MKNVTFTLLLLTMVSASMLYPMEHQKSAFKPFIPKYPKSAFKPFEQQAYQDAYAQRSNSDTREILPYVNQANNNLPIRVTLTPYTGYNNQMKSNTNTNVAQPLHTINNDTTMFSESKTEEEHNANNHMDIEMTSRQYFNIMIDFFDSEKTTDNDTTESFERRESGFEKENNTPEMLEAEEYNANSEDDITELFEVGESTSEGADESTLHPLLRRVVIIQPITNEMHKRFPHKSFPCTFERCNKSFTLNNLDKHMKTHAARKRPSKCTFTGCNKAFAHRRSLTRHIKDKHNPEKKA